MMNIKFLLLLIPLALAVTACQGTRTSTSDDNGTASDDEQITKNLNLGDFNRISIQGTADVVYTTGQTPAVKVSGIKKSVDFVKLNVSNGTLVISERKHEVSFFNLRKSKRVVVYVTSPQLNGVDIDGTGDFTARNGIQAKSFHVSINGTGDADFKEVKLQGDANVEISGTGDVEATKLSANRLKVETAGTGDVTLRQIVASSITAETSGTGDILLDIRKGGDVNLLSSGMGSITVKGNYKNLKKDRSGLGSIHVK